MNVFKSTMLALSISITAQCSDKKTHHYTNKYIILSQVHNYINNYQLKLRAVSEQCNAIDTTNFDNIRRTFFEGYIPSNLDTDCMAQYASLHRKFITPQAPFFGINRCAIMSPQTKKSIIHVCKERTPLIKRVNRSARREYYCHDQLDQVIAAMAVKIKTKKALCAIKIITFLSVQEKKQFLEMIEKALSAISEQKKYKMACMILRRKKELVHAHNKFFLRRPPIEAKQHEKIVVYEDLYDMSFDDAQISELKSYQQENGITESDIKNASYIESVLEQIQAGQLFNEARNNDRRLEVIQTIFNQKVQDEYLQQVKTATPLAALHLTLIHVKSLLQPHHEQA